MFNGETVGISRVVWGQQARPGPPTPVVPGTLIDAASGGETDIALSLAPGESWWHFPPMVGDVKRSSAGRRGSDPCWNEPATERI